MRVKPLLAVSYRAELSYLHARHLDPCDADKTYTGRPYFVDLSVSGFDVSFAGACGVWEYDVVPPHPLGYFVCG